MWLYRVYCIYDRLIVSICIDWLISNVFKLHHLIHSETMLNWFIHRLCVCVTHYTNEWRRRRWIEWLEFMEKFNGILFSLKYDSINMNVIRRSCKFSLNISGKKIGSTHLFSPDGKWHIHLLWLTNGFHWKIQSVLRNVRNKNT